jgi:hypothetical protein
VHTEYTILAIFRLSKGPQPEQYRILFAKAGWRKGPKVAWAEAAAAWVGVGVPPLSLAQGPLCARPGLQVTAPTANTQSGRVRSNSLHYN